MVHCIIVCMCYFNFNFNLFNVPQITTASEGMCNKSTAIDRLKNTVKIIHICRIKNSILGQNLI